MEQQLTSVHTALANAATEQPPAKEAGPMGTHTFRIHDELKAETKAKCEQHGTTFDAFLRKCCEGLVSDYRP